MFLLLPPRRPASISPAVRSRCLMAQQLPTTTEQQVYIDLTRRHALALALALVCSLAVVALCKNIAQNQVAEKVTAFNLCGRTFVPTLVVHTGAIHSSGSSTVVYGGLAVEHSRHSHSLVTDNRIPPTPPRSS